MTNQPNDLVSTAEPSATSAQSPTSATAAIYNDAETSRFMMPPEIEYLLGPPDVTTTEIEEIYREIEAKYATLIQPTNLVEWQWVRELADLTWEETRLREAQTARLKLSQRAAAEAIFNSVKGPKHLRSDWGDSSDKMAVLAMERDPAAIKELTRCRAKIGLDEGGIDSVAYLIELETMESLQVLLGRIRSRRTALIGDIGKRRSDLAKLLKASAALAVDGREDANV